MKGVRAGLLVLVALLVLGSASDGLARSTGPPFCPPGGCAGGTVVSATTTAASSVDWSSAVLSGSVATGQGGHYHFDYGNTTSYGSSSPDAAAPTSGTAVQQTVTGLTPTMLYHFRVVASDSTGTQNGDDQTFITLPQPVPSATTGSASAVSGTAATLHGTVNPEDSGGYHFDYGPSTHYGYRTPRTSDASVGPSRSSDAIAQKVSGLSAGATYHFRVVATNGAGTSYGADRTFTTPKSAACTSASARLHTLTNRHASPAQLKAARQAVAAACGSDASLPLPAPTPVPASPPPGVPIGQGHVTRTQCGTGNNGYGVRFGSGGVFGQGTAPGTTLVLPSIRFLSGTGGTLQWTLSGPGTVYVDGCDAQYVAPGDAAGRGATVYVSNLLAARTSTGGESGPQDVDGTHFAINVFAPPANLCGREYLQVSLPAGDSFFLVTNNGAYGPYQFHTWQPIAPGRYDLQITHANGSRLVVHETVPVCGYAVYKSS